MEENLSSCDDCVYLVVHIDACFQVFSSCCIIIGACYPNAMVSVDFVCANPLKQKVIKIIGVLYVGW